MPLLARFADLLASLDMKNCHPLLHTLGLTIGIAAIYNLAAIKPQASQIRSPQPVQAATLIARNPWQSILGKTVVPDTWTVKPCNGEAPFLCVSADQAPIGSAELQIYPIERQTEFQRMLVKAGIPASSGGYASASRQAGVLQAMRVWVEDQYVVVAQDRRNIYGKGGAFLPQKPQVVKVGGLWGLKYGFVGRDRTGKIQEHQVGYVAFDGRKLYVITTSFDPADLPSGFRSLQEFQRFEPFLSEIVSTLKLSAAR